jgi:hypothetical protein
MVPISCQYGPHLLSVWSPSPLSMVPISCQHGPQLVVITYTVALKSEIGSSYRCDFSNKGTQKIRRS